MRNGIGLNHHRSQAIEVRVNEVVRVIEVKVDDVVNAGELVETPTDIMSQPQQQQPQQHSQIHNKPSLSRPLY